MEEFRFENTVTLTESQYVAIWSVLPTTPWFRSLRLFAITTLGVILLFSTYTVLIGLILLGSVGITIFVPGKILPIGTRSLFRRHIYLKDPLTYGVSDQKLWVKGGRIDASVQWSMLEVWRETEDWLVLCPSGIPPLYLSLTRLRAEGLYDRVKDLAKRNGKQYYKSTPPRSA